MDLRPGRVSRKKKQNCEIRIADYFRINRNLLVIKIRSHAIFLPVAQ